MRKNRLLTPLSSGALMVAVATGGMLLIDGVCNAAPSTSVRQVVAASTSTETTLSVSASSVPQGELVTLTATIRPAAAAGTVQFKDGTDNLGDPMPVSTGTATATISTSALTVGRHSLTAVFTPTSPSVYSSSTSTGVFLDVTAPTEVTTTRQATILTQSSGSIDLLSLSEVKLAARLIEAANGEPVPDSMIEFYGGGQLLCQAFTDANGLAQCSGEENVGQQTVEEVLAGYDAVFSGNENYRPSAQHASATIGIARSK